MLRIANRIILLALLIDSCQSPHIQRTESKQQASLGWDLTYSSVLERNKVARDEWLWQWLGQNYQSPVKNLLEHWEDEPILSSILIEHPVFHAGEHIAFWLIRTKNHAYYWKFAEGKPYRHVKESVSTELYDHLFEQMASWQQAEPSKPENTPVGGISGYLGFLSLYDPGNSRQMLLSREDFYVCKTKDCEEYKEGRLVLALEIMGDRIR
ncbi:MAG TPA: hypothetical protein VGX92_18510 [Pyrinomonadaceae bacterium]|jgi:hypothetical protein|nr:hypothetical protein [Pyrinomonadaceae bacterium]